jgi:CRISPR-associated exonuclease Cas4
MSREIVPDQDHPYIEIGRIVDEESYDRDKKKINLGDIVLDIVRGKDEEIVIGEVKKSSKAIDSATLQLAFYLYKLKELGISCKGILLFPKERKRIKITLNTELESKLLNLFKEIEELINNVTPPNKEKIRFCTHCAYREFCWA